MLLARLDWLYEEILDSLRTWIPNLPDGLPMTWTGVSRRARELGIRVHGHFSGEPGEPDAQAGRRALHVIRCEIRQLDAVLLIRDTDDQPQRRDGLEQARGDLNCWCPIILAVPHCEREAWVISGFDPQNNREGERLAAVTVELGFDPRLNSESLTACKHDSARRSAKRVLSFLTDGDRLRETSCWMTADLEILRKRGASNGLLAYLNELQERLVPLISKCQEG
ncbi:MAG TPA: hypothetical protein DDY91_22130 [Planctomycetaceae bacterium]|nr:hypothetical protein [Planctomycetaceae bacterium]